MRHVLFRLVLTGLVLALLSTVATAGTESQQVFAHLFTVPAALPGGEDTADRLPSLEAWLAETFGGYTRFGPGQGGWKNETGQVEIERNTTYLVTAPRDFSKEIAARLAGDFGVRVPYVLVLPAGLFAK